MDKKQIVVYTVPIGKPRMTRQDKWKIRPCVAHYRAFADALRLAARRTTKIVLTKPTRLDIRAFFYSNNQRTGPHTQVPDFDNIAKACADALFQNDQMIYEATVTKLWAGTTPARVEIDWA